MSGKFVLVLILCLGLADLSTTASSSTIMPTGAASVAPSTSVSPTNGTTPAGTAVRLAQGGVVALVLLPIALYP